MRASLIFGALPQLLQQCCFAYSFLPGQRQGGWCSWKLLDSQVGTLQAAREKDSQGTLQGKGQLGQGGKRNGADGRVHELGGMKRQNALPKTGKILMRSRKCPVTPANNGICVLLHPWEIPLYKAFSIPTRKKRLGFAYSTSSHRECS
jgi:hypothetical protein